jgi:DUF438 domain-containing protein
MSEFINNREYRQQELKKIIQKLHEGATVEAVKQEFEALTQGISAVEITEMEQALVNEGLPVEEIQRLCDVHASVFKGSIEEIHQNDGFIISDFDDGHPIHTFKKENRVLENLIEEQVLPYLARYTETKAEQHEELLRGAIDKLKTIDKHYTRKEQLLFPYLEKYDITAPAQVMWGVDDEIRGYIKNVYTLMDHDLIDLQKLNQAVREAVHHIQEMIFKEEEILLPMALEKLQIEEWKAIEESSSEIGYTLLGSVKRWNPKMNADLDISSQLADRQKQGDNQVQFDAGSMTPEEINSILNTLPLDMTFVGADNKVKYFTQGKERIFDRPKTIIGREVKHCHPPKSVHVVEQIVEQLRSGQKDHEDFWIKMGSMYVLIRYYAVRNKEGEFLGTLEITQDIKPIQEIEGEKRLMS